MSIFVKSKAGATYQAGQGIDAEQLDTGTLDVDLSDYQTPGVYFDTGENGFGVKTSHRTAEIAFDDYAGGGIIMTSNSGPDYGGISFRTQGERGLEMLLHGGGGVTIVDSTGQVGLHYENYSSITGTNIFDIHAGSATLRTSGTLTMGGDVDTIIVSGSSSVGQALRVENSGGTALLTVNNAGGAALTGNLAVSGLAGSGLRAVDTNADGDLVAIRPLIPFGKFSQYSTVVASSLPETTLLTGLGNGTLILNSPAHPTNPELYAGAGWLMLGQGNLTTGAALGGLRLRLKLDAATIADSGTVDLSALLPSTTYHVRLELDTDVRDTGVNGSVFVTGRLLLTHPSSGAVNAFPIGLGTTTAIDTTVNRTVGLTIQQTTSAATFSLQTFKIIPAI